MTGGKTHGHDGWASRGFAFCFLLLLLMMMISVFPSSESDPHGHRFTDDEPAADDNCEIIFSNRAFFILTRAISVIRRSFILSIRRLRSDSPFRQRSKSLGSFGSLKIVVRGMFIR